MTEEQDLARPRATPARRTRRPAFAQHQRPGLTDPISQLAPDLQQPWTKEDTDAPDRTAAYTHPEGHSVGIRLQNSNLAIQTWITAGPGLPPIPVGTDIEQAEAQAANDARLQPGRTWHAVLSTRANETLAADLSALVHERLLPALTNKPRRVLTLPKPAGPQTETAGTALTDPAPEQDGTPK